MRALRRLLVPLAVLTLALAGCSSTVALQPAEDANNPLCAEVTAYLPASIDGESRRWTDAQATGAWGDPTRIILTCGVTPPAPSELVCQTVNGVDWLIDDSEAPNYRVTSYGRDPAVQVYFDSSADGVSSYEVLNTLSTLVSKLPKTAECIDRPTTESG